jgi:ankyrin repeat protein
MASDHQALLDAFIDACWTGDLLKTQEAIASGQLNVEELDEGLVHATDRAFPDIVAALFDAGARVSASTVDALPAPQQNPRIILQFLDHGLDPNARLSNGEPLLGLLVDPACARALLSRGADPNICGPAGYSPLFYAIQSSKEESKPLLELLELLLEHGAKLEPDLLFAAVTPRVRHHELMTRFLLAKGLDPSTTINAEWGTPLHLAVYAAKPNLVKLLMDAGADPTSHVSGRRFPGKSPLQMAQTRGDRFPEVTQAMLTLLQRGL